MKITFTNPNRNTEISVSDDTLASDSEILIEMSDEGRETWHSFTSLEEFADFCEAIDEMRKRFRKHLEG